MQFLRFIIFVTALVGMGVACQEKPDKLIVQQSAQPTILPDAIPPVKSIVTRPAKSIAIPPAPTRVINTIVFERRVGTDGSAYKPVVSSAEIMSETAVYHLPIVGAAHIDWFIGSYVDMNKEDGIAADFMGGFMTYDTHQGTDFFIRDLAHMDTGVPVVAARGGTIAAVHDGEPDLMGEGKERQPNYIKIVHMDESTAYYSHLRQHSIVVAVGEEVVAGQELGLVGNSGYSSSHPHLHFEVYDANGRLLDIFDEETAVFNPHYPIAPFVFATGITDRNDPYLFSDLSQYTPAHNPTISCTESPYIWYKVVRMGKDDSLHTVIVHPNGATTTLMPIVADRDYRYIYWHVYSDPLPSGVYRILYYFNNDSGYAGEMTLYVNC